MMTLVICTLINLGVSLLLVLFVWALSRPYRDLGWQEVSYKVRAVKQSRKHGRRAYIFLMDIGFRGSDHIMVITQKQYDELSGSRTGRTGVYVREFKRKYLNPVFEKYEFSLEECVWEKKDRENCIKGLFISLITFEALLCLLAYQP